MENIDVGPQEFEEITEFLQKERDALQEEFDETNTQERYISETLNRLRDRYTRLLERIEEMDEAIKFLKEFWGD